MKSILSIVVLGLIYSAVESKESPPKVQVYSRNPGEYGKDNTLICHVSGFHPPDISIQLLQNGKEIPNAKQTDLAFEQGWQPTPGRLICKDLEQDLLGAIPSVAVQSVPPPTLELR
ncbi:hypothetical protein J4Q44_G00369030 [Coregonus suidteri]|uniref:Beta-2-microglobulin n=1 Tax=Coregonus suidteri TaxID=861788 RepID=A0AAN8KMH2_9TELE